MDDNSELQRKIIIRNDVFKYFDNIDVVFDLYAGDCEISERLWSKISRSVIAVDKKECTRNLPSNINFHHSNSKEWTNMTSDANVVDCDAYGLVIQHVSDILALSTTDKIIFFTDGTPTKNKRMNKTICNFEKEIIALGINDFRLEINDKNTAYYGWVYKKCDITSK